jgi:hypothetical protein
MRTTWLRCAATAALAAIPLVGSAQIRLAVRTEHQVYLQYETAHAFVTIYNDGENVLSICDGATGACSRLEFLIEKRGGDTVRRVQDGSPVGRLQILPGEQRELVVDLTQWYDVREMGRYLVRAALVVDGEYLLSEHSMLDVVRGLEILSVTRGVLGYAAMQRTYSLRYWRRDRHEFLFLTVDENPSELNQGVFQLGRLIRVAQPRLSVDARGNVEVYHQSSSKSFVRTTLRSDGDGVRFIDQRIELESGEPFPNVTEAPERPLRDPSLPR